MAAPMLHVCFLLLLAVSSVSSYCIYDNRWMSSFDQKGHTTCPKRNYILTGFYRSKRTKYDPIGNLEKGRCCSFPAPYSHDERNVVQAEWIVIMDYGHNWAQCPPGYFLSGLYRGWKRNVDRWWKAGAGDGLNNIHEGRCTKPASAPTRYGECYVENISSAFDDEGSVNCKDGYFLTGIMKNLCDELFCLEKLKCCKLAPKPRVVDGLESAKLKVMDNTLVNIAELAHYLGYGWCLGCRAAYIGEDFRRDGDSWKADKTGVRCSGTKWDHRLSIKYGDWKFTTKDIKLGKPEVHDLKPEIVRTGEATNRYCDAVRQYVTYASSVTRTVSHSPTSKWGPSHAAAISIVYQPTDHGGITASAGYEFSYTDSSSTTDEKGEEQSTTYSIKDKKTIKPNSKLRWTAKLFKTRKSIPYTATILIHFSAELQGFLRYGGGYNGVSTNYYRGERGSEARKTKNFKFGGREKAFYTDLKQQEETRADPWMWGDLAVSWKHKIVAGIVKALVNEGRYEFTLAGQFDDIVPKDVRFEYEQLPLSNPAKCDRRKRAEEPPKDLTDESKPTVHHIEARPTPEDEPSPVLKPPVVVIPDVPAKGIPDHIDIIDDGDTA